MENKTGQYLKYAIGEIILVVIGILIALSINNWNENRIQLAQGQTLMLELIEEIKEDINTCNWAINNLKNSIERQEAVFRIKNLRSLDLDSLKYFFSVANLDIKIDANTQEKINNLSVTTISPNNLLNNEINEYFDISIMQFNRLIGFYQNKQEERWRYLNDQNTYMFNSDLVQGFNTIGIEESKSNFIKFINLPQSRFTIKSSYNSNKGALETVQNFKEESINILEKIHAELLKSNPKLKSLPNFSPKNLSELVSSGRTVDTIIDIIKKQDKVYPNYIISESEINILGYAYMIQGRNDDALKILKLNTELYPNGFNTHDSYGECLLTLGDTVNGIKAYKNLWS